MFLTTSAVWICCSFMAVVFPCLLKWYFEGTRRRVTRMLVRLEVFDPIVKSMFPRLKYTRHSFPSLQECVWCVWSELPNEGIIITPSGRRNYCSSQNHRRCREIHLTYLFIPPPVAWFHLWVDTFLSIIEFLCWSMQHMFPERRILSEELNALNSIGIKETFVIIGAIVVWIRQMISTDFARCPTVGAHRVWHFFQTVESSAGWSEVADCCHCRVPEKLVDSSSAQVELDAPVR